MTKERVKTSRRIKALKKRETKIRRQNAITLDRLIRIEAATHDRKIPCDVLEFADKVRWSNSKQAYERIGDLTLPHLIRAVLKDLPPHSQPNWVDYILIIIACGWLLHVFADFLLVDDDITFPLLLHCFCLFLTLTIIEN